MDQNEDASDTSSSGSETLVLIGAALRLRRIMNLMESAPPLPPPIPKLTGAQWMQLNLHDPQRCINNLRMDPDTFMNLHRELGAFGLKSTRDCGSIEALGLCIWTCAHGSAVREAQDRFERSLDTVSRKVSAVANVLFTWAQTVIVASDPQYGQVSAALGKYAPWFDGCIGAIDGTHVPVEVNREAKVDFIDRKGDVSINVCAVVDMHGVFTYVGAGKAGACHDMHVLQDCQNDARFPHPPPGASPCNPVMQYVLCTF